MCRTNDGEKEGGSSPRVWGTRRHLPRVQHRPAVHPHGCGEHRDLSAPAPASSGSSPRVWGTRWGGLGRIANLRFIPTGVGNTAASCRRTRYPAVHPHGCGEHVTGLVGKVSLLGSSPRVWGTPLQHGHLALHHRFIPTGVGNTLAMLERRTCAPVHPHGCGEHPPGCAGRSQQGGSSPRVWGTQVAFLKAHSFRRFIPTGVGNTTDPAD